MRLLRRIKQWASYVWTVGVHEERDYVVVFCGDFSMILPSRKLGEEVGAATDEESRAHAAGDDRNQ